MILQKGKKDCLQVCLCELLKIDYEKIPKFYELYTEEGKDPDNVFPDAYDEWLQSLGYERIFMKIEYKDDMVHIPRFSMKEFRCIGILNNGKHYDHAVILNYKNERIIIEDPLPDTKYGIEDIVGLEFIYKNCVKKK